VQGARRLRLTHELTQAVRAATAGASLRLFRNSVAFSAGTVMRLSIGFLTWIAAAHLYPAAQVGIAAGAISAMTLCVHVGILGADLALIRLYPERKDQPAVLLDTAITFCAIAATIAALAFIGLAGFGLNALHILASSPSYAVLFMVLTVFQAGWWLMDQSAVAVRSTGQVPIRAVAAAGVTLTGVITLGAVGLDTAASILAAWLAAAVVACVLGLFQLSRITGGYRFRPQLARSLVRRLMSIGLPNFLLTTADEAPALVLPIIAAELIDARAAAYWYAVWMMAIGAYTISMSFGLNMFAEAAWAPSELQKNVRHALRLGLSLAAAASAALLLLGPFVLAILGSAYADHATGTLRLMALVAVPMVVTKSYLFTCRATGRMREGTLAATVIGIAAVGLAAAGAQSVGLSGIAGGWLAVQAVAALAAGLRLRMLVFSRAPASPAAVGPVTSGG
jgi:O-antigen/teichoic acid export membrane protein